ncbi:MAG: TolC family protein [Deltaproteobacteria bacterium]|nr:TolC family protein [Deltaproteobacteria bacterium]
MVLEPSSRLAAALLAVGVLSLAPAVRGETAHVAPVRQLLADPGALARWLAGRSPDVAAARARSEQVAAELAASRLLPNPQLSFSLGTVTAGTTNPPGLGFGDTANYTVGLSQPLDLSKRGPRIDAAMARHASSMEEGVDGLVQRVAEARQVLGRLVHLAARERLLGESLASARQVVSIERTRLDQGYISGNDFDRLNLDTMGIEADLARAQAETEAVRGSCRATLAAVSCPVTGTQAEDLDLAASVPASASAEGGSAFLDRRPDLRAVAQAREAARWDALLARRRAVPDPTLTVGFTRDQLTVAGNQANSFFFGLALTLPVFDRGQHDAARAHGRQRELEAAADALRHRAVADLEGLTRRSALLERTLDRLLRQAVPRSAGVLATTLTAFRRGQVSLTDLLLARRAHLALRLNTMDLRFDLFTARSELRRVLGLDASLARQALARKGP